MKQALLTDVASRETEPMHEAAVGSNGRANSINEKGHWLISGTGRAGTTFLVRYLAALGLDTHLAHNREARCDEHAHAGLEDFGLVGDREVLPKVVKSPWVSEYIEELLSQSDLGLDLAILPVRELSAAASSRVVLEMRARHQNSPWIAEIGTTWETWGTVPGGAVYSLHPLDQARVLAVGFHRLVQRLVEAEVPILFLNFPRFIRDGDYLLRCLRPYLPDTIMDDTALDAHSRLADLEKVRIEREISATPSSVPNSACLENIALKREIQRLQRENRALSEQATQPAHSERGKTIAAGEVRSPSYTGWWQRVFRKPGKSNH
jgi:hypothetical protein